jgi:hypothetical protein
MLCPSKATNEQLESQIPSEEDTSVKFERERVDQIITTENKDILMVQNLVKKYINKDPNPQDENLEQNQRVD